MGRAARPLPFRNIYVLDKARVMPEPWLPNSDAPWTKVDGQDLPSVMSAIWPGPLGFGRRKFYGSRLGLADIYRRSDDHAGRY